MILTNFFWTFFNESKTKIVLKCLSLKLNAKLGETNDALSNVFSLKHKYKKVVFVISFIGLLSNIASAQATFSSGSSNAALKAQIAGSGVTIFNEVLTRGELSQVGVFSNGVSGANLEINSGIILTTGTVTESFTTNDELDISEDPQGGITYSDPDIIAIDPSATRDVVVYEFDVTLDSGSSILEVTYQFASDEYPDYVGSRYNDIFGYFISGPGISGTQNLALVPGTTNSCSVNTVNGGVLGCNADGTVSDLAQSAQYINNGHSISGSCNDGSGTPVIHSEYNGFTHLFAAKMEGLATGASNVYHFKIAIADTGDSNLDSAVFIDQIFAMPPNIDLITTKTVDNTNIVEGDDVNYTLQVRNNGSEIATGVNLTDLLPSGLSFSNAIPTGGTINTYNSGTGKWDIGNLAIGATATLVIRATVGAGTSGSSIINTTTAAVSNFADLTTAGDDLSEVINVLLDSDHDGISDSVDLDDDNDGILDSEEGCGKIISNPNHIADGLADVVYPVGAWEVLFYGGHFGVANAVNPIDRNSKDENNSLGVPTLYGEGYSVFNNPIYTFDDPDIDNNPFENPVASIIASGIAWTDSPINGTYGPNTSGTYTIIYKRKITNESVVEIGESGAYFDDFAELFVNGTLVGSINQYTPSLNASAVIKNNVLPGDEVEIRLTNGSSLGGFKMSIYTLGDVYIDTDNDGIVNCLDLDSDNDGIYDAVESGSGKTVNANGQLASGRTEVNANGIPLAVVAGSSQSGTETVVNYTIANSDSGHTTNSDSIPNYLDTDSDGDNCSDANEAYNTDYNNFIASPIDSNGDGTYGGMVTSANVTSNGTISGLTYTSDASQLANVANEGTSICNKDTDGDGIYDAIDLDDDNDGILDADEMDCPSGSDFSLAWESQINPAGSVDYTWFDIEGSGVNLNLKSSFNGGLVASSGSPVFGTEASGSLKLSINGTDINDASENAVFTFEFSKDVQFKNDISLVDIDRSVSNGFQDAIRIEAVDNQGKQVPVTFTLGSKLVKNSEDFVVDPSSINQVGFDVEANWLVFNITEPFRKLVITYDLGDGAGSINSGKQSVWLTDFTNINAICDTDNDGIPNDLDLDSDNDGIYDAIESGSGQVVNANGQLANGRTEVNANGIPLSVVAGSSQSGIETTVNYAIANSDSGHATNSDSIPNYLDTDSDGDDCGDANEAFNSKTTDSNGDGTYGGIVVAYNSGNPSNVSGVNSDGLVNAATYSTTAVAAVTNSTIKTGCAGTTGTVSITANSVPGDNLSITVTDGDLNVNVGVAETIIVAVTNDATGEIENITLTETGVNTGVFSATVATVYGATAGTDDDGVFNTKTTDTVAVTYDDNLDADGNNPVAITATDIVGATAIDAVTETFPSINGTDGGTTASVLANDELNGVAVIASEVNLTAVSVPTPTSGSLALNADGTVTVGLGTPAGTYDIEYSICEKLNPTNCDTVISKVVVGSAVIAAVTETFPSINGTDGGTTASVLANDELNGVAVIASEVNLTAVSVPTPTSGSLALNADGTVTVGLGTPAGTYDIEYSICEKLNPTNCDTVISKVVVGSAVIAAVTETFPAINGTDGGTTASVLTNDELNGVAVIASEVNLTAVSVPTPASGSLALNADGTVTVGLGTPAGTYDIEYSICEKLNPTNCDTVISKVVVGSAVIAAVTETFPAINGTDGGTTSSVLANDELNGVAVITSEINLTAVSVPTPTSGSLALNADGTVTVGLGTPAGTYDIEYSICEKLNPTNCDTVISKVVVGSAVIAAVTETFPAINGTDGGITASVLANDELNGVAVIASEVNLTAVSVPTPASGSLALNADGTVTVGLGTPAGTYDIEYSICEKLNPTNCDTVISKVVVGSAVIAAVTETFPAINGTDGGTTVSVLTNDELNGVAVIASEVNLTAVSVPTPASGSLALNADGTVTVGLGTPAGTYDIEYSICEKLNPTNCDTVISKVVVGSAVIAAVTETFPAINGTDGGTTSSVLANDELNGVAVIASEVNLTAVSVPTPASGSLNLNADGTVTIGSGTSAGTYDIEYSICEKLNPTNCDTVISKVVVGSAVIAAVTETFPAINGTDGGTTSSVLANDELNGVAVIASEVNLTAVSVPTPASGSLALNADGTVTVGLGTPAGTYDIEYSICEKLNPTNCDTVISKVVVGSAVIDAATETFPAINGTDGGTTASVLANDELNGVAVIASEVNLTAVSVPTPASGSLALNADGTVTVGLGTPAGTYDVEYSICEKLNPTNCDTVISKVVVGSAVIAAVTETFPAINGTDGGTTSSVLANDELNGVAVIASEVNLTAVSIPTPTSGSLALNADGTVTIGSGTPAGTYDIEYSICEKLNPTNCDTVISKVVVGSAVIAAVAETFSAINGTDGGTTASVLANDELNGVAVIASEVNLTAVSVPTPASGSLALNADGTVTVGLGTPAGTYDIEYSICEKLNPTNCDTVISKVVVGSAVIAAVTETFPSINGTDGGTTASVLANDELNGVAVIASEINLTAVSVPTPTSGSLALNADGTVTVGLGTPAGTYDIEYSICEKLNPTNCDTVISKVVVGSAVIAAVTETFSAINGTDGGTTASVLANDELNGVAVIASEVNLTAVSVPTPTSGSLALNADGTVTVGLGTPAGTYDIEYSICEKLNPTNCDTVISKVVVGSAVIAAVTETFPAINGTDGGTTASVLTNDELNGVAVIASEVNLTAVSVPTPASGSLNLNADGTVTIGSGTPAGTYDIEYSICEKLNPTNCDTVISKVVVGSAVIDAATETFPAINGTDGGTTSSVLANDELNGVAVIASEVNLTAVSVPTPASGSLNLNADGTVTIGSGTSAGTYDIEYSICEKLNPTNCDTVISKVVVGSAVIAAVTETFPAINGTDGGTTSSVLANDELNGVAVIASEVNLTAVSVPTPASGSLNLNADGTVTIGSGTSAGTYDIEYSICEKLNPTNCDTVISKVVVGSAVIIAIVETINSVNEIDGGTTLALTTSDTLNGNPVVIGTNSGEVTVTVDSIKKPDGTESTAIVFNPDATVTIPPNTEAGTYKVTYTICEITNPTNCSQITEDVTVDNCLSVSDFDCDNDGLSNAEEITIGTNPNNQDSDGDGVLDGKEVSDNTDPTNNCDLVIASQSVAPDAVWENGDCDGDTITNAQELVDGTAPFDDCDAINGIPLGTSDCDDDGLTNEEEEVLGTDPNDPDSDKDGIEDGQEVTDNTSPLDDCDSNGGTPLGSSDCDNDGLTNDEEAFIVYKLGESGVTVDPNNPDSDGDGILDGQEVADGTNPTNPCDSIGGTPPSGSSCGISIANELITADGDGANDFFKINNINNYPDNTVEIFNRWGVLVYKTQGYNNENNVFRGVSNGRSTLNQSDKLPAGVYFYIINITDNGKAIKDQGYIYIVN